MLAADVYAVAPHVGRGGWTWYTGSAGWMYRLLTESLLGLHREGDHLVLQPCIPTDWTEYRLHYRYRESMYLITITQVDDGEAALSVDGFARNGLRFELWTTIAHHVEATCRDPADGPRLRATAPGCDAGTHVRKSGPRLIGTDVGAT